jgi:hypothetical protein
MTLGDRSCGRLERIFHVVAQNVERRMVRFRAAKCAPGIPGEPTKLVDVYGNTCGSYQLDS